MKTENIVVMPKSRFLKIVCKKCKSQQVVFNKAATQVKCNKCGEVLVEPTGGESYIYGKLVHTLT